MLFSREKTTEGRNVPHFSMWFGNFFEPYYSDRKLVEKGIEEIRDMGFNSVILDSKLWKDFTEYFETGKQSEYVAMQKYMIECCKKYGIGVNYLALFYNGDNLYPHIRDSAPDIISPVIDRGGKVFRGLKHWDKKQTEALAVHTANLYNIFSEGAYAKAEDENGEKRIPCYFYHSPALMPSFDEDGRKVYFDWLAGRYKTVSDLNSVYGTDYESFDDIAMQDIWPVMTAADYSERGVRMLMHRDNMLFRQDLLDSFFAELTASVREKVPGIYLYDCLSQWKYFLPDWVEISERGLDIWRLGKHLDCPSFYTLPVDTYGEPNCYAVSLENSILRSASVNRHIVSGLFLGRYLYNDVYAYVTPAEAIASSYGAGAKDMFFYGYSGLDDGGNFGKMKAGRKLSVKSGLEWFTRVREVSGERLDDKKVGIVFPYASFTLDNRGLNDKAFRLCRNDMLGYYMQFADLGINADILDINSVSSEELSGFDIIVLPSDPFYKLIKNESFEKNILEYVKNGGKVFAGASSEKFEIFGIEAKEHEEDSVLWKEKITDYSLSYKAFSDIETTAVFGSGSETAIGRKPLGSGTVYAFGIDMGVGYCERRHKPVAVRYGRENHYPLTVLDKTVIEDIMCGLGCKNNIERGVERVRFENGLLIINHNSYDYALPEKTGRFISTCGYFDGANLPPHHSVFICR